MKLILKSILSVVALGLSYNSISQCTVSVAPVTVNAICGEQVDITAGGITSGPVLFEDFNSMTLGVGWNSTQILNYTNPCGPSLDGTPSAWMGSTATQPRQLSTVGFDLQCGAEICFDLDFAGDDPCGGCTSCEDPDLFSEGVHFNYSIDGGASWVEIFYFEANSANTGPYYSWGNYCFMLPPAGFSANTMFQWSQDLGSSINYDHWGIDNVYIQPVDCNNNYYFVYDDGTNNQIGDGDTSVFYTTTTTLDVLFTNGIDDSCYAAVTVNVSQFDVNATATNVNLGCGECTDLDLVWVTTPNITGANYVYSWTPITDLSDPNIANPTACPSDNITYTGMVTETNSGCVGSDPINITVSGGGAIADFSVFPGLTGCPPFDVDFTNNSTGQSYEWFIDGVSVSTLTDFSNIFNTTGTYDVELVAYLPGLGCINWDTAAVVIEVGNAVIPNANFDFDFECGITAINAWNTGTQGLTYDWNMGDGTTYTNTDSVSHNFPSTGAYTVSITAYDAICGTSNTYSEVINVVDNPITYIFNEPTCYQFSDGSITVNLLYNTGTEIIVITDDQNNTVNIGGSNAANQLNGGWYYIDIDLGGGCTALDSVLLTSPDELLPQVITFDAPCFGDASGIAIVDTVTGWQGNYTDIAFFWNPNPMGVGGIGADTATNMPAGNYVLTVNDGNGCDNTFDFTINEPPQLSFSQLGTDPAYCRLFDYQSGNGVVWASAVGGTPDYDYIWTNLQDSTATSYTTWGGLNPGQYEIIVIDNNGCVLSQIVTVDNADPIADFTMTSPDFTADYEGTAPVAVHFVNESSFFANPNNPNADTTFYWNFNFDNTGWVISHDWYETFDTTYLDGGVYTVCLVAINKNGCTDTACKEIIVYDPLQFSVVNIFTPNADGANDEFTFVYRADAVSEFSCIVVNRWGTTIREFTNITDTWNGTDANGSECRDGVYFYKYNGTADNGDTFEGQGTVNLVRGE